jgi:hypothetical protein
MEYDVTQVQAQDGETRKGHRHKLAWLVKAFRALCLPALLHLAGTVGLNLLNK